MRSTWLTRGAFAALVLGVLAGSGCAEERDPINRVQVGAVPKAFFLGNNIADFRDDPEFYVKSTSIDSGANTDNFASTIGIAGGVDRIRWEVTEDYLIAHRSYQESPGADNRGLPRIEVKPGVWEFPTPATGTIIAAYKIESHFDVRRGYNPSTGEEANTLEENSSDRPWQEREYMRIDWSKNVVKSTSNVDTSWVFGSDAEVKAVEYYVTDVSNVEDRPHYELTNGYFDITNKYTVAPSANDGWGIPTCVIVGFLTGSTSFDCTPTEVKYRHSYLRIRPEDDFEPFEESKATLDVVGHFGNGGNDYDHSAGLPITTWDPQYGYTDAKTKTFMSIHNIWEKSHLDAKCDSNDDADGDGTADACTKDVTKAKSDGSQCDVNVGKCTIPVRDRKVKTIGYWLNADAPPELGDQLAADGKTITQPGVYEEMTDTWNQFMKVAVATRREVECRRTKNGSREDCHSQFFDGNGAESKQMVKFGGWGIDTPKAYDTDVNTETKKDTPIVATCHNPVRSYDQPMCGKPGDVIRLGDVRKNYAIYWPYNSRAQYGGVATISSDPLTGQLIGVTATTMLNSTYYSSALDRDILQLAMGDLKIDDLLAGVPATRYADRVKNGKVTDAMPASPTSSKQLAGALKNLDVSSLQAAVEKDPSSLAGLTRLQRQLRAASLQAKSSPNATGVVQANERLDALMARLSGDANFAGVTNRGLKRVVAETPMEAQSSNVYQAIKQFADKDPGYVSNVIQRYQAWLSRKGICTMGPVAAPTSGSLYFSTLAPYYKKLYGDLDPKERGVKIYQDLVREEMKGTSFHEMGHSLGMRHNFSSSWDSMNYMPQYWQLRTNEKGPSEVQLCTDSSNGGDCMGPRYLDPLTDDEAGRGSESRPGIDFFANTSTMEYTYEWSAGSVGAGTYDLHAMKSMYGRVLETFDSSQVSPADAANFGPMMVSQAIPKDLAIDPSKNTAGMHYTKLAVRAKVFDPKRDCRPATDDEKAAAKWRIVHGKVCSPSPKNHLAYEDMKTGPISIKIGQQDAPVGVDGIRWKGTDENGQPLVRWQYRYGEDYGEGGFFHAKPFDLGADLYEVTRNELVRYDVNYWHYFRKQKREWAWWGLPYYTARTFENLRSFHWTAATDIARAASADLTDDDHDRPAVMATNDIFNFLQSAILTPEVGAYTSSSARTAPRQGALPIFDVSDSSSTGDGVSQAIGTLGLGDGRYVGIDFDNSLGGSWDYQHYPSRVGYDEEKSLALRELVDPRPTLSLITREAAIDGRDPYVNLRTTLPHAVDRLVGGILSEDWETVGPSMNADGASTTVFSLVDKDPANLSRPSDSKGIVFPNIGYINELNVAIYGLVYSRLNTDMLLAQKMRIRYDGDNAPVLPPEQTVVFSDPVTGFRYIAGRYGTEKIAGRDVERGIASRMLQHANDLLVAAYSGVGPADPITGERQTTLDASGAPVATSPDAEKNLRRYVGLLDAMRQVGNIVGGGPF